MGNKSLIDLMEYPLWNYVTQVFNYTRAYADALTFCSKMYDELQKSKSRFSDSEFNSKICSLYLFELLCLFKLDRWDDFMDNWNSIFRNVKVSNKYSKRVKDKPEIQDFILGEDQTAIFVHFLWGIHSKKKSVERKIQKRNAGKKIGNLLHEQQCELSSQEILERFDWIVKYRSTGEYDFSPPALRQKLKRKNDEINTLNSDVEKKI